MLYKIRSHFSLILCSFLFIVSMGVSIHYEKYAERTLSSVSIRYDKAAVTPKQIDNIFEKVKHDSQTGLQDMTLWNRRKNELIQSNITNIPLQTNIIEVYGDMSQVCPANFVCGNYVYENDADGCVLASKMAYQLFGCTDIINNTIIWMGKKYSVRGVVKSKDTMMLIQVPDKNYLYSNVEAVYPKKVKQNIADNEGIQLKNLLAENGLPSPNAIIDGVLITWFLHILCNLPLWIIVLAAAILMIKRTCNIHNSIALLVLYGTGTILMIFIMIRITNFSIHIPSQFIPTKWSDFNFYIDKYNQMKADNLQINQCIPMPIDIARNKIQLSCIILTVVNLLLLLYVKIKIYKSDRFLCKKETSPSKFFKEFFSEL